MVLVWPTGSWWRGLVWRSIWSGPAGGNHLHWQRVKRWLGTTGRKSVENLVISSQDAIGQSISQALTFSGVITQHANQIIQETRNVSRPPSPSIRNVEPGLDSLDNDKVTFQGSNLSLHVASHSSADSASVSSATDLVTIVNAPLKGDKVTSPNPAARTADGAAGRSKKKSWYNSLYPTYKSKSEDFKRLFKDLPDDERLIVDYSCALQKDILVHGRLYASQNYLCFYASIFGWETSMSLRWKDVTAITKEKTALVIPNAILVCTEADKNFLTSFSRRDKTYLMLFRIWQNALMDQPMTSHEIWQWVHSCYGEELGFNSDDEGYGRDFPEEAAVLPPDNVSEDLVDSSMEASGGADSRDEAQHSRGRHSAGPRDCSPPLVTNGEAGYNEEEAADALPTDMSDTSDSEPDKPHNGGEPDKCTASHEGKLLLRQQFPFNVDQLFTMIFTNSKFNLELLAARGTTDYVQAPWQPAAGLKCRQLSYTLGLTSGPIGPKEVQVTETQVMNKCSKPGVLYSIDSTSENAGIPYADYFSVKVHYCLQRVAEHATSLTIIAHIHYKKTMWPMVKGFLEKNTMSGLEEYTRLIESHLGGEAHRAAPPRAHRRHRRPIASPQEAAVTAAVKSPAVGVLAPRGSVSRPPRASATDRWLLASLLLLLLLNALLYWKLYRAHSPRPAHVDQLHARMSSTASGGGAQAAEWARLLAHHARQQRAQLHDWRQALDATRTHLLQTEQALMKLLETIKPSLEAAKAATDEEKRTDL